MDVNKVIIGSHNTMTYLKPSKWYVRLFNFIPKCQNLNLTEQLKYVDCVDLRVYFNYNKHDWYFAHGVAEYDNISIYKIIGHIYSIKPNCIVRLILEKTSKNEENEILGFTILCDKLKKAYGEIKFIGGIYRKTWSKVYDFGNEDVKDEQQFISSRKEDVKWYECFIPKLYAKRMNKINIKKVSKGINLFDFLEIDINNG